MTLERLFNDNDEINDQGRDFANEVSKALKPIVQMYSDCGYSLQDVENLVVSEGIMVCIEARLDRRDAKKII